MMLDEQPRLTLKQVKEILPGSGRPLAWARLRRLGFCRSSTHGTEHCYGVDYRTTVECLRRVERIQAAAKKNPNIDLDRLLDRHHVRTT